MPFRIAILLYFLALFAIRGLLFPGGPNDDSEQLLSASRSSSATACATRRSTLGW